MSARPGRLHRVYDIDFERPRELSITTTPRFFEMVNEIKAQIDHKASTAPNIEQPANAA